MGDVYRGSLINSVFFLLKMTMILNSRVSTFLYNHHHRLKNIKFAKKQSTGNCINISRPLSDRFTAHSLATSTSNSTEVKESGSELSQGTYKRDECTNDGPLTGVRVIEVGNFIAGPHCATILGYYGELIYQLFLCFHEIS